MVRTKQGVLIKLDVLISGCPHLGVPLYNNGIQDEDTHFFTKGTFQGP